MASRAQRAVLRAAEDRKTQVAAGTLAAAGAVFAGKVGADRLRENGKGSDDSGPSRAYRLKGSEKPKKGVRRIARGRAENALEELDKADEGSVHEARKDLKKLRALLRLVRDDLGDSTYRVENRRYRDAGRNLSAARDAQVKLETLASLRERFPDQLDEEGLRGFQDVLEEERRVTSAAIEGEAEAVVKAASAIAKGRDRVSDWPLNAQGWSLLGPGLVCTYRRGRKMMERTLADPSSANVHEWRKRTKDLWYQLRILRDAWPEVIGPLADQSHELGDVLGDHHDLEVLAEDVRGRRELFTNARGAEELTKVTARRQQELLERAIGLGPRLYADKPSAFGRRFESYWAAWRT